MGTVHFGKFLGEHKGVGIGGARGGGAVAPPSQLLGGLSPPPPSLYQYLLFYVQRTLCPQVSNTGASVACTATGCNYCLLNHACIRFHVGEDSAIQRRFSLISGCGLKYFAMCTNTAVSLAPPTKYPFLRHWENTGLCVCVCVCVFGGYKETKSKIKIRVR